METPAERYCSQCGLSVVPLDKPHVARICRTCGRDTFVQELGPDGGIEIRKGDRFTIPAGWLSISLDPSSRGKLFRPGLRLLLKGMFAGDLPTQSAEISRVLDGYCKLADEVLEKSDLLKDLDLETEAGGSAAYERLESEHRDSREWFALLLGSFAQLATKAITDADAEAAALWSRNAASAHAATMALEPVFEQTVWRGYLTNTVVYEAVAATAQTVAEQEAIRALEPLFRSLDEPTLHAWVESDADLGPRLGIKSLPEPVLKALAKFHLAQFTRRREEEAAERQAAKDAKEFKIKWLSLGAGAATAIISSTTLVLRLFGLL